MYYSCLNCKIHYNELDIEDVLKYFIKFIIETDLAMQNYYQPVLGTQEIINTDDIDIQIKEIQKQNDRIKKAILSGAFAIEDFKDEKLINDEKIRVLKEKLSNKYEVKTEFKVGIALANRDLVDKKLIDFPNIEANFNKFWESKSKEEKQEYIAKHIENMIIKRDEHDKLYIHKINFRKSFLNNLTTLYKEGLFNTLVPISINDKEDYINATPNISHEMIQDYRDKIDEFYETTYYNLDKVIYENEEFISDGNEKALHIFQIKDDNKFSFNKENANGEYGLVTYKPLCQDEICITNT